jgi:hypothetical protein
MNKPLRTKEPVKAKLAVYESKRDKYPSITMLITIRSNPVRWTKQIVEYLLIARSKVDDP